MYVVPCAECGGYDATQHQEEDKRAYVRQFFRRTPWHVLALGAFSVLLVTLHLVCGAVAIYAYEDAPEFAHERVTRSHLHSSHHGHGHKAHEHPAHAVTNVWLVIICFEITVNGAWLACVSASWWALDRQVGDVLWMLAHYNALLALSTGTGIICMGIWELPARSIVGATSIPGMLVPVLVFMAVLRLAGGHRSYRRAHDVMMRDILEPWEAVLMVGARDRTL